MTRPTTTPLFGLQIASCIFAWLAMASTICGQVDAQFGSLLIEKRCLDCHDSATAEGELDLERMLTQSPLAKDLKKWRNIAKRIELGDMPPAGEQPLGQQERLRFAAWFDQEIEQFAYETVQDPGYEPVRRLTHIEYRHTIRDLFGVDLANTERFPQDLSGNSGFDNSSNTLFLQGSLFEKYAQSAESIVSQVFADDATPLQAQAKLRLLAPGDGAKNLEIRAARVIRSFCDRAFRRPATPDEFDSIFGVYQASLADNKDFESSLQRTIAAVLVMPIPDEDRVFIDFQRATKNLES